MSTELEAPLTTFFSKSKPPRRRKQVGRSLDPRPKMVLSKAVSERDISVHSTFASRYVRWSLSQGMYLMPDNSIPKGAAYQNIKDELMLDGNLRLNLASSHMVPECDKLVTVVHDVDELMLDGVLVHVDVVLVDGHHQQELHRHGRVPITTELHIHCH
ncbi:hypothetical protein ACP70R_012719 [Stipagrostis hirtigluma subsp. patula]